MTNDTAKKKANYSPEHIPAGPASSAGHVSDESRGQSVEREADAEASDREPTPPGELMSIWLFIKDPKHSNAIMAIATVMIFLSGVAYTFVSYLQWKAADKTANIAKESLESVQRAFVTVAIDDLKVERVPNELAKETEGIVSITVWARNNGSTPGINAQTQGNSVAAGADAGWGPFEDILPGRVPAPPGSKVFAEKRISYFPPQSRIPLWTWLPDEDEIQYMKQRRRIIHGWAIYNDVFNLTQRHVTMYCFIITALELTSGGVTSSFQMCGTHNCVDENCKGEPGYDKLIAP